MSYKYYALFKYVQISCTQHGEFLGINIVKR